MSEKPKVILVTGFAPFGGEEKNPSFEAVRLLPDRIGDTEIVKAELPVVFGEAGAVLEGLLEKYRPDTVIAAGLAGGRHAVTPEVMAINLRAARIPDNAGQQPVWEKIAADGPDGLFSTLPVREMTEAMKHAGISAELSFSAGTFVCNEIMYRLLLMGKERYPDMKAGFVHVPYASEFTHPEGAFSMPLSEIARALSVCIDL